MQGFLVLAIVFGVMWFIGKKAAQDEKKDEAAINDTTPPATANTTAQGSDSEFGSILNDVASLFGNVIKAVDGALDRHKTE